MIRTKFGSPNRCLDSTLDHQCREKNLDRLSHCQCETILLEKREKNYPLYKNSKMFLGLNTTSILKLASIFSLLGYANGILDYDEDIYISSSWLTMKTSLCMLIYIKEHFDRAILNGESVPSVDINTILSNILEKINSTLPIKITDQEINHKLYYVGDYLYSVSRKFILNKTDYLLDFLDHGSFEQYDKLHLANLTPPAIGNIENDEYSNAAIVSNISRKIVKKIHYRGDQEVVKENTIYCKSIVEYISTLTNSDNDPEPETIGKNIKVIVLTLAAFSFLLVAYFIVAFVKNKFSNNCILRRSENDDNVEIIMLSDIEEEEEVA